MYSQWSSCWNTTVVDPLINRPTSLTPSNGKICDLPPANTKHGMSIFFKLGLQSNEVWSAIKFDSIAGSARMVSAISSR